jgi:hypothetical protein
VAPVRQATSYISAQAAFNLPPRVSVDLVAASALSHGGLATYPLKLTGIALRVAGLCF